MEHLRDKHKLQYQRACQIIENRAKNNIIVDKRLSVLQAWHNLVKTKHRLLYKLDMIYTRNLKHNVFEQYREQVYQDRKLSEKTKKLRKFVKVCETCHYRQAFSRWRIVNYNAVTTAMFTSIKNFEESKLVHQKELNHLNKEKSKKAEKVMGLRKKAHIFTQWFYIARFSKA